MALAKYPHLLKADIPVWERWLAAHADEYDHIDYDVRVGEGRDPGPEHGNNIRQMALDLSRRRIDAVAHQAGQITVIEITTDAGLKAVGQLAAYPLLYRQTYGPTLPIRALLVAQTLESDVEPVLQAHKIAYELV